MSFITKNKINMNKYDSLIIDNTKELFLYVKSGDINKINTILHNFPHHVNIQDENEESLITTLLSSEEIKTEQKKLVILKILINYNVDPFIINKYNQHIVHLCFKYKYADIWKEIYKIINESHLITTDIFKCSPIHYLFYNNLSNLVPAKKILGSMDLQYFELSNSFNKENKDNLKALLAGIIAEVNSSNFKQFLIPLFNELSEYYYISIYDNISNIIEEKKKSLFLQVQNEINTKGSTMKLQQLLYNPNTTIKLEIENEIYSGSIDELKQFYRNYFKAEWKFLDPNTFKQNYSEERKNYITNFFKDNTKLTDFLNNITDTQNKLYDLQKNYQDISIEYIRSVLLKIIIQYGAPPTIIEEFDIYLTHPKAIIPRGNIINLIERTFIKSDNSIIINQNNNIIINNLNILVSPNLITRFIRMRINISNNTFLQTALNFNFTPRYLNEFNRTKGNIQNLLQYINNTTPNKFILLLLYCIKHKLSSADILYGCEKLIDRNNRFEVNIMIRLKVFKNSVEELYYFIIYYLHDKDLNAILLNNNNKTHNLALLAQPLPNIVQFNKECYIEYNPLYTLLYEYYNQSNYKLLIDFYKSKNKITPININDCLKHLLNTMNVDNLVNLINNFAEIKNFKTYKPEINDIDNLINYINLRYKCIDTWTLKQIIISFKNTNSINNVYDYAFFNPFKIFTAVNTLNYQGLNQVQLIDDLVKIILGINSSISIFITNLHNNIINNTKTNIVELITVNRNFSTEFVEYLYDNNMLLHTICYEYGVHPKYTVLLEELVTSYIKYENLPLLEYQESVLNDFITVLYSQTINCTYLGTTKNMIIKTNNFPSLPNLYQPLYGTFGLYYYPVNPLITQTQLKSIYPSRYDTSIYNLLGNIAKSLNNINIISNYLVNLINEYISSNNVDVIGIMVSLINRLKYDITRFKLYYKILINENNIYISSTQSITRFIKKYIYSQLNSPELQKIFTSEINEIIQIINSMNSSLSQIERLRVFESNSITIPLQKSLDNLNKLVLDKQFTNFMKLFSVINGLIYWEQYPNKFIQLSLEKKLIIISNTNTYFTSFEVQNFNNQMCVDILNTGDIVLGIIKEDIIEDILINKLKNKTKLNYDLISKMISDYLIYIIKFYMHEIVQKKYQQIMLGGSIDNFIDLTFQPELRFDTTRLQGLYIDTITNIDITYRISMDIISPVNDWEFNNLFVKLDNNKIGKIIDIDRNKFLLNITIDGNTIIHLIIYNQDVYLLNKLKNYTKNNKENYINFINSEKQEFITTYLKNNTDNDLIELLKNNSTIYSVFDEIPLLKDINNLYNIFITQILNFINKPNLYDKYYKLNSADCILKINSDYYTHSIQLMKSFIKIYWLNKFERTYNEILINYELEDLTKIQLNINENIDDILIELILKYPKENNDMDLDTYFMKLKYQLKVNNDKVNEYLDEIILPYYKKLAITVLNDFRTITTNIMRFKLNIAIYDQMIDIINNA